MWSAIIPVASLLLASSAGVLPFPPAARPVPALLAPANEDTITLEGVDLGKPVTGPEVKEADLKGKAVVFEYWGDECGPCLANIPHICEVQKTHGREKLIVVANQVWTEDVQKAKEAFESRAPKDHQVSVVNHGALKGAKVRGVPHAFVFNPDGSLRWQGHPAKDEFEEAVKEAVALVK